MKLPSTRLPVATRVEPNTYAVAGDTLPAPLAVPPMVLPPLPMGSRRPVGDGGGAGGVGADVVALDHVAADTGAAMSTPDAGCRRSRCRRRWRGPADGVARAVQTSRRRHAVAPRPCRRRWCRCGCPRPGRCWAGRRRRCRALLPLMTLRAAGSCRRWCRWCATPAGCRASRRGSRWRGRRCRSSRCRSGCPRPRCSVAVLPDEHAVAIAGDDVAGAGHGAADGVVVAPPRRRHHTAVAQGCGAGDVRADVVALDDVAAGACVE